jgi:AcrR family transcriptional regulator
MPAVAASPPESASDEKRARILRAALEVCGQTGVTAARMEEIAARAEVSKGTLYRYFESKEDLLLATLLESYEQALKRVDFAFDQASDPGSLLGRLCDGFVDVLSQVGAHARVYYQVWGIVADAPAFEARLLSFLRAFHAERHAEIEALVRAGQVSGSFRSDVAPLVVADSIGALLSGFIYRASFDPVAASPAALRACLAAIRSGLLEPGEACRPARIPSDSPT